MRPSHLARLLTVSALGLILAGCGGSSATPTPVPTPSPVPAIELQTAEFAFTPDALTVPAGSNTTIRLVNKGVVEHDLTIDALALKIAVKIGGTAEGVLTAPAAGTYDFYCSLPGHKENGMVGTLTVE